MNDEVKATENTQPEIETPVEIDIADFLRRTASLMAEFAARLERMEAKVEGHEKELGAAAGMMGTVDQMAADLSTMREKMTEYLAGRAHLRRLRPGDSSVN
jgi:hypothetical protein